MATSDTLYHMNDLSGSQASFTNWLKNFAVRATAIGGTAFPAGAAAPLADGLALINGLQAAWQTAYDLIRNTETRTHKNIVDARNLRFGFGDVPPAILALNPGAPGGPKGIVGVLRQVIKEVVGSGVLTVGSLANLGLTVPKGVRSIPQIPTAGPELYLEKSAPHVLTVMYHQEGRRQSSRAKPPGCKSILLQWTLGNGKAGSVVATKNPARIDVGAENSGQSVRVQGFWQMGNSKSSGGGNFVFGGVP